MTRAEPALTARMRATRLNFASATVVHITMSPHEPDGYVSTTDPFAIGISYTGHSNAVLDDGSRRSEHSFAPGTCAINGTKPVTWLRVAVGSAGDSAGG